MTALIRLKDILYILVCSTLLVACSVEDHSVTSVPDTEGWPSKLVPPINGTSFSVSASHLPGAPREFGGGTRQGFDFFDGHSGRPLAEDEPVVSVASGEIIRIDQADPGPAAESLGHWAVLAAQPGFAQSYALDQLHGRQVWIRHASGHVSRYAHLSMVNPNLAPGQQIEQGQVIGLIGRSGVPDTAEEAEPVPRLNFQLWSEDGETYFGEGLHGLGIQTALAAVFGETVLARASRKAVAEVAAGAPPPPTWPPEAYEDTGFGVDAPDSIVAGNAFVIGIHWTNEDFLAEELIAFLGEQPLGVLSIEGGAAVIGAARLDQAGQDIPLVLGATDPFGRFILGARPTRIVERPIISEALEVDAASFETYNDESFDAELLQIQQATAESLAMLEPAWRQAFVPPIAGDVVGVFGQEIIHAESSADHPLPGILILPMAEPRVQASNDGVVHLVAELPIRGRTVAIAHGGGIVSIYSRLESVAVTEGQRIARGQPIGAVAADGPIEDRLLLWEMHVAGTPSDPLGWLGQLLPGQNEAAGSVQ